MINALSMGLSRITIGILIYVMAFGQTNSNVSKSIQVKDAEEFARERQPELFLPRSEFETSAEYAQRVARGEKAVEDERTRLRTEEKSRHAEQQRLADERRAEAERQKALRIAASRTSVTLSVGGIGTYDADRQTFPLTVDKETFNVAVPRSEARSFKENYRSARVEGYQQLGEDLQSYEKINLAVIHPVTGSRYPMGPQKQINELAASGTKKQSVVPPDLTVRVAFVETNGDGYLNASETGKVKVLVSNSGRGAAMGVTLNLHASAKDEGVSFELSKLIGEIPVGQTRSAEFQLNASRSVTRMTNLFTLSATESYGFQPDPVQISFETLPFIPPKLELVDFGISTATGDNVIRPGVVTTVQARVQNRGQGIAEKTKFTINLAQNTWFTQDSRKDYNFASLKPGEFKDLEFSFIPNKNVGKTLEMSIGFVEEGTNGSFPLKLDVEKPQRTIEQLVVKGKMPEGVNIADVATVSVDVEKDIPRSRQSGKNDLAVVFGIERYKNVPGVTFAKRDAQWMMKYFEDVLGIPAARIYYKTDSDVSLAEFNMAFGGWLSKRLQNDSNVFIYYAGHGSPDIKQNKAYLIPYDGNPNYASVTGYELNALYQQLGELGAASVTVFLDACFSGANRESEMLLADARPVFMEVNTALTGNVTVFSASSGKEISSAWPEKKHGIFSYYLMKGMRGDADDNQDKKITVGELGDYLKNNVTATAGMLDRDQTPGLETRDRERVLISY